MAETNITQEEFESLVDQVSSLRLAFNDLVTRLNDAEIKSTVSFSDLEQYDEYSEGTEEIEEDEIKEPESQDSDKLPDRLKEL